jgi:hypothetical protein
VGLSCQAAENTLPGAVARQFRQSIPENRDSR